MTIRNREKLHQDIKRWEEILGIDERIRYLRRVEFIGYMSLLQDCKRDWRKRIDEDVSEKNDHEGDEDGFFNPTKYIPGHRVDRGEHVVPQEEGARNKEWLPVARLLEQLPNLRDVVYACTHRIPICILTTLHQHHPNTRLHLHAFYQSSLPRRRCVLRQREINDLVGINPDEVLPPNSPYLHSIVVLHYENDYYRQAHYSISYITGNTSGGARD